MRFKEFAKTNLKESDGATCAASIATVVSPFFASEPVETPKKKPRVKKPLVIRRS